MRVRAGEDAESLLICGSREPLDADVLSRIASYVQSVNSGRLNTMYNKLFDYTNQDSYRNWSSAWMKLHTLRSELEKIDFNIQKYNADAQMYNRNQKKTLDKLKGVYSEIERSIHRLSRFKTDEVSIMDSNLKARVQKIEADAISFIEQKKLDAVHMQENIQTYKQHEVDAVNHLNKLHVIKRNIVASIETGTARVKALEGHVNIDSIQAVKLELVAAIKEQLSLPTTPYAPVITGGSSTSHTKHGVEQLGKFVHSISEEIDDIMRLMRNHNHTRTRTSTHTDQKGGIGNDEEAVEPPNSNIDENKTGGDEAVDEEDNAGDKEAVYKEEAVDEKDSAGEEAEAVDKEEAVDEENKAVGEAVEEDKPYEEGEGAKPVGGDIDGGSIQSRLEGSMKDSMDVKLTDEQFVSTSWGFIVFVALAISIFCAQSIVEDMYKKDAETDGYRNSIIIIVSISLFSGIIAFCSAISGGEMLHIAAGAAAICVTSICILALVMFVHHRYVHVFMKK